MGSLAEQNSGKLDSSSGVDSIEPIRGGAGSSVIALMIGATLSGGFYAIVNGTNYSPLERYFLGHPVAIVATCLFFYAVAILAIKQLSVRDQWRKANQLGDASVAPRKASQSPADEFFDRYDAGFVARQWLSELTQLPLHVRNSRFVHRLAEVLSRQSERGTTKHLSDDLREFSARDADEAHDSFALIRIIVWAIPMLGFLGTVIGITQTLGGLDFTDGKTAVENLKSGLYVAFDTTALGLVLSVVAIFLQFPVEKSEQGLLATIDQRVAKLTSVHLPGDEPADNQYELLASLCDGVRAAVAESLDQQAKLWRQTIDEAQGYWQQAHNAQAKSIVTAVQETLVPALRSHSDGLDRNAQHQQEQLNLIFAQWQNQLNTWQATIVAGAEAMVRQQSLMLDQVDQAALVREQATSVLQLQQTLASNLQRLDQANQRIDDNLGRAAGNGMADAMMVLARAVDVLNIELGERRGGPDSSNETGRRAA